LDCQLPESAHTAEQSKPRPRGADDVAIMLPGGGARAAYQVGFLRWVSRNIPEAHFPIVTGVSAGAINATFLAAFRGPLPEAVDHLCELWRHLTAERVFRTDGPSLSGLVARWSIRLIAGGAPLAPSVQGLVDTSPLRDTLASVFGTRDGGIAGIAENIAEGRLWALALLTSHYGTGQSVVWTQGRDLREWERPDRRSRNTALTLDHVLASSALPLFFPAVRLTDGWHGDGGIRLTAPFSPALHLGASRILAVSTRYGGSGTTDDGDPGHHPPPMQIAGQLLDAVFLDDLDRDALELERINRLLREVAPEKRRGMRPIELLVIRPSVDISRLAAEYEPRLPRVFRHMVRGLGSREVESSDLLSLLTFQPEYLGRLIALGEADAATHGERIRGLLRPRGRPNAPGR
jgi:NTE family protein